MLGWSGCSLYPEAKVPAGTVVLPRGNAAGVQNGDQVHIQSDDWEEWAQATLDTDDTIAPRDRNNIRSGKWTGPTGRKATYRRIGAASAKWHGLRRSTKAMVGGLLALIAIALLFLNAALNKEGHLDPDLTPAKWLIFGLGVLVAFASWAKDNLV
jgi:hypothetical protein